MPSQQHPGLCTAPSCCTQLCYQHWQSHAGFGAILLIWVPSRAAVSFRDKWHSLMHSMLHLVKIVSYDLSLHLHQVSMEVQWRCSVEQACWPANAIPFQPAHSLHSSLHSSCTKFLGNVGPRLYALSCWRCFQSSGVGLLHPRSRLHLVKPAKTS